jgi:CHAT domain-containing protein
MLHQQFEERLNRTAIQGDSSEQVQILIREFAQFAKEHLYLQQWLTFADIYIDIREGRQLNTTLRKLSDLHAQPDLAPRLRGRVLNAMGVVYEMNEQWDRALRAYQDCINFYETEQDELRLGVALYNVTILHWKAQDYPAAIGCVRRSIDLLSRQPGNQEWETHLGTAWNTYGFTRLKQGQLQEAQDAFEHALTYCQRYDNAYDAGLAHNNLGHVYRNLGELEKADEHYQQACTLTQATKNFRETAEAMYGRCLVKLQTSTSLVEIQQLFDETLNFATTINNHEVITDLLLSRASWYEQQGNVEAAFQETQKAVDTVESLRANIMLPDDRARMTASKIRAYEQMVGRLCRQSSRLPLAQNYAKAFHNLELAKSRTFVETLDKRLLRPPQNVPTAWLTQENDLRQKLNLFYREHTDLDLAKNQQIADLEIELTQLRERIRLQDAEFQSFDTAEPLSLEAVQAALPDKGLLLEYFTVADEICVFVITKQSVEVRTLPLRLSELALAFKRVSSTTYGPLHNMTRDIDQKLYSPWILHNLYQRLIEPLGAVVREAASLAIIPHGLLHYVPFHALYAKDKSGPRYLTEIGGEARPLVYAPSATLLFNYCQQKPLSMQAGCFALGFNNHTLTQAEFEAQRIAQIMNGVSYVGEKATRSAFFTQANNYRFVHLSCHGWFNPTWPLLSSITIADGAIDVTDILQRLQLNAELVCLSACETGRSHIMQGDELVGLSRAFLYGGTPAVLVSQWVVDELSTRLFMENFYSELATDRQSRSMNIALALSRAQQQIRHITKDELYEAMLASSDNREDAAIKLDFLHKTSHQQDSQFLLAHPYYWAPFFLIGDRI